MAKVFISFTKRAKPDEQIASYLSDYLEERQQETFIQTKGKVGQNWPEVVASKLSECDYLIVLLSAESAGSEMVIEEVRRATSLRHETGKPVVLPVLVNTSKDVLPYDLAAWVNRLNYAKWVSDGDEKTIAGKLYEVIASGTLPPEEEESEQAPAGALSADGAAVEPGSNAIACPLPSFDVSWLKDLNAQGGPVRLDSPFYVSRPQDETCRERIVQNGRTLLVRGSRQIGKTSLMARLFQYARDQKVRAVFLDFRSYNQKQLTDLDTLLLSVANQIFNVLKPPNPPGPGWTAAFSATQNLTQYLQDEVIAGRKEPVVLFMEVDRLFAFPAYSDDFFSLIRFWHDGRAVNDQLSWLNLVLAYSTETSMFITTPHQSPFNVGEAFELSDFTRQQFEKLNLRHGSPLQGGSVDACWELIGGHPFLVRQALYELAVRQMPAADLLAHAVDDDGPFSGHLQPYILRFQENQELIQPMQSVLQNGVCPNDLSFYRLRSLGLVRGPSRLKAAARCGLYAKYFGAHL